MIKEVIFLENILFMIPTLGGGGAERVLVTLLNSLDSSKYNITLLCLFDGGTNKEYLNENITYEYFWNRSFRGNIHLLKLFTPEYLYTKIVKEKYDIAISYLEGPTTRIVSGCPYPETKLINWVHIEADTEKSFTSSYRNLQEMILTYNKYDKTVFVSQTAKQSFHKMFNTITTPMEVKYNSVDNKVITDLSQEEITESTYSNEKINLVSVGRFTEQKGYIRLIKIINNLVNNGYSMIHLYLLGTGELENKYRQLIKKHQLDKYITLLGYQDNPYKFVKNADLFVCSSYKEGFSTAVTESLIVGTPVITTLCSGMEELLGENNEYGIITENSEEAFYEGLKKLLNEPEIIKYYEPKVRERGKNFELTETVNEIEKMLESL